jgi:tetratricopeptide (TPR) repeat protein
VRYPVKIRALILLMAMSVSACSAKAVKRTELPNPVVSHSYEADYYFMRGYEAAISSHWEEALNFYRKAVEYDPKSAYLKTQVGMVLYRTGDYDGALRTAEEVVSESPEYVPALMLKAELLNDRKKLPEAIEICKRILKIDPGDRGAAIFLGRLYYSSDRIDDAIGTFEGLAAKDPGDYVSLDYLSSLYIEKKDFEKARKYLDKTREIRPNLDTTYFKLGLIDEMTERLDDAAKNYEIALDKNPHNTQARERLARVYLKQKSLGKAIEELETLSKELPGDIDIHVRLGMLYFEEKEYDRAIEEFRLAVKANPEDNTVRYYLALVLEETERFDEAAGELKTIISREPKNINAFLHLAYIYSRLKKDDDAIKIYEEILEFEKEKPEIYLYLAGEYIHKKDYGKAGEILKGAISKFGDNDELYYNLAIVADKTGRFDDMVAYLRKALEINPENADALNYLGYSYADRGIHLDEAVELITRALKVKPDNGYILDSLGWAYFRQGSLEKALGVIRKAAELTKEDPVVLEHLGDIYERMHKTAEARDSWEKALRYHEKEEGLKERVEKKIRALQLKKTE